MTHKLMIKNCKELHNDFDTNNELEIYAEIQDFINEEISYKLNKKYKKDNKIK